MIRSDPRAPTAARVNRNSLTTDTKGSPPCDRFMPRRLRPTAALRTMDLKFVERRFGPVPEEEFDPDRFLDGPQTTMTDPDPFTDEPSALQQFCWLPFPIGALCLVIAVAISIATRRKTP